MTYKDIAKLSTDFMALGLAGENIKFAMKKKKKVSDFAESGIKNMLGIGLIHTQAKLINDM